MHESNTGSNTGATAIDTGYWVPVKLMAITVSLIALLALALVSPFAWISGLLLLSLVGLAGPIVLTIMTIYGQRDIQAFGIGALFPAVLSFATVLCLFVICTFGGWDDAARAEGLAVGAVASLLGIGLCGSLGIAIRRSIPGFVAKSAPMLTGQWQISIATLLGTTAGIALILTVLFKVPPTLTAVFLVGFAVVIAVALTILVVYARGVWQTFGIGGLFPAAIQLSVATCLVTVATFDGWDSLARNTQNVFGLRVGSVLSWLMIAGCGWLAVRVRKLVEQRTQVGAQDATGPRS